MVPCRDREKRHDGAFVGRHPDSHVLFIAEEFVTSHGSRALLFAKFVLGLSLTAPPLSGTWGIGTAEFLLFDAIGALIWVSGFAGIGFFFGSTVGNFSTPISPMFCLWISAALAIGVIGVGSVRSLRRKPQTQFPLSPVIDQCIRTYKSNPAKLTWLHHFITRDAVQYLDGISEAPAGDHYGNLFFSQCVGAQPTPASFPSSTARTLGTA
jgi:hypothetical protein